MGALRIDETLATRLYERAKGERWSVPLAAFVQALEASADRVLGAENARGRDLERQLSSLHLEDLALACACAAGEEMAWEHFVRVFRPQLYRAADALDPSGGCRDIADSLYADLYGLEDRAGERRSLFRYFHGRSSLATWLRAVLAQRHVDRLRSVRRLEPLLDETAISSPAGQSNITDPECGRYRALITSMLAKAVADLEARDRLRLGCYYAQGLTLAQTGRLLREHEATVSRNLTRTRRMLREDVERRLHNEGGLNEDQVARCFECITEDAGALDLARMLPLHEDARDRVGDRSTHEGQAS